MTNKEFFVSVLKDERPRFKKVLEALPEDKVAHKVHDRSRDAGNLAAQLAQQWQWVSQAALTGTPNFSENTKLTKVSEMLEAFDSKFDQMLADLDKVSDTDWENGKASMGDWETKRYWMAWGFLFDAIHHRGQLSSFLRNMGAKVPAVYGPSADSQPT